MDEQLEVLGETGLVGPSQQRAGQDVGGTQNRLS